MARLRVVGMWPMRDHEACFRLVMWFLCLIFLFVYLHIHNDNAARDTRRLLRNSVTYYDYSVHGVVYPKPQENDAHVIQGRLALRRSQ